MPFRRQKGDARSGLRPESSERADDLLVVAPLSDLGEPPKSVRAGRKTALSDRRRAIDENTPV